MRGRIRRLNGAEGIVRIIRRISEISWISTMGWIGGIKAICGIDRISLVIIVFPAGISIANFACCRSGWVTVLDGHVERNRFYQWRDFNSSSRHLDFFLRSEHFQRVGHRFQEGEGIEAAFWFG